jgi:uncharacterized membrane protein
VYEARHQPLLARSVFYRRVLSHVAVALGLVLASLGIGIAGYMITERMPLLDAFLNAAMLLGGMGPVATITTPAGKLFAGVFALYAGLVFVACAALVLTPLFHRLLHRFHVDDRA